MAGTNIIGIAVRTKRAKFTLLRNDMVAVQAGAVSIQKSQDEASAVYATLRGRGFKVIDRQGSTVFMHA